MHLQKTTAKRVRELLDYDSITGIFHWKKWKTGMRKDLLAGCSKREVKIFVDGTLYLGHRLAWLWVYGDWPANDIDHIDGNPLNNSIANLRDVSKSVNLQNRRRATRENTCGFLGVRKRESKWEARIKINGKDVSIGRFSTPEQAHQAYLSVKREAHEGCTI